MKMKIRNSSGFSHHLLLPVIAFLLVASIGGYIMQHSSSAATPKKGWTSLGETDAIHNDSGAAKYVWYGFSVKVCKIQTTKNTYTLKINEQIIGATNPNPVGNKLRLDVRNKSQSGKRIGVINLASIERYNSSYKPSSLSFKSSSTVASTDKIYAKAFSNNANSTKASAATKVSSILTCK